MDFIHVFLRFPFWGFVPCQIRKKLNEKLPAGATPAQVRKVAPGVVRNMNEEQRVALRKLAISFSTCFTQINFTADERPLDEDMMRILPL